MTVRRDMQFFSQKSHNHHMQVKTTLPLKKRRRDFSNLQGMKALQLQHIQHPTSISSGEDQIHFACPSAVGKNMKDIFYCPSLPSNHVEENE